MSLVYGHRWHDIRNIATAELLGVEDAVASEVEVLCHHTEDADVGVVDIAVSRNLDRLSWHVNYALHFESAATLDIRNPSTIGLRILDHEEALVAASTPATLQIDGAAADQRYARVGTSQVQHDVCACHRGSRLHVEDAVVDIVDTGVERDRGAGLDIDAAAVTAGVQGENALLQTEIAGGACGGQRRRCERRRVRTTGIVGADRCKRVIDGRAARRRKGGECVAGFRIPTHCAMAEANGLGGIADRIDGGRL